MLIKTMRDAIRNWINNFSDLHPGMTKLDPETCSWEDVVKAAGRQFPKTPWICLECGKKFDTVVILGDRGVCADCLQVAINLIQDSRSGLPMLKDSERRLTGELSRASGDLQQMASRYGRAEEALSKIRQTIWRREHESTS